jgi:PTS system galactitol-specific IIA component
MGHIDFDAENREQVAMAIEEKLILVKETVSSREEIIRKLGDLLYSNKYVKDTYTQAVLDREVIYPTGLQARVAGVAIPHTDTDHVISPAVAVATLQEPVIFKGMGAPDNEISVDIVMMLAIHDPNLVVKVLRNVIFILEDDQSLAALQSATSKAEIKQIIENHIKTLSQK